MALAVADYGPNCGLVLLRGAIFDAVKQQEKYGPMLGLSKDIDPSVAGYVGLGSLFAPELSRDLYRCPRCPADTIIESSDERAD